MKYIHKFNSLEQAKNTELYSPLLSQINDNGRKVMLQAKIGAKDTPIKIKGNSLDNLDVEEVASDIIIHYEFSPSEASDPSYYPDKTVSSPYTITDSDLPQRGYESSWYYGNTLTPVNIGDIITENITITTYYETCLVKDTSITLSNGTTKLIQDITYDDELLVWDFDNAQYSNAKPLWIKIVEKTQTYWLCKLENGTKIKLVGSGGKSHRLFNYTDQVFEYPQDCIGKEIYTENGISKLVSCERIIEEVEYYNIITEYHMNLFANSILTSCRYNNIYNIKDMKFVKDNRNIVNFAEYNNTIPYKYYVGMRLGEQTIPVKDTIEYVQIRINKEK